jgi:3-oxoacyl-[acyl-carrier protein] reductase
MASVTPLPPPSAQQRALPPPFAQQAAGGVALVSGGSRGIGALTVRELAAAGWSISFCHRGDEEAARETEKAASELGARVLAVEVDLVCPGDVAGWFRRAEDELGPVGAVVSCAALARDRPLARLTDADWRAVTDTGLDGLFRLGHAALLAMMPRGAGRIVVVSSVSGVYAHARCGHDARARPGVAGFVRALASQAGRFGISVNAVVPGPVAHDLTALLPKPARVPVTETVALRRFGDAAEAAGLVAFLLSAEADGLSGRVLEARSSFGLLAHPGYPNRVAAIRSVFASVTGGAGSGPRRK